MPLAAGDLALYATPVPLLGAAAVVGFALGLRNGASRAVVGVLLGFPFSWLMCLPVGRAASTVGERAQLWVGVSILMVFQIIYVILTCRWIGRASKREPV